MINNKTLDFIINLIDGAKQNGIDSSQIDENALYLANCNYLLSQILRQLILNDDHYFVSEAALALWQQIRDDSIFSYTYRDTVVVTKPDCPIVDKYTGSQKNPRSSERLHINEKFPFNDIFTDEHIVPINVIIKQLKELKDLSYENVLAILNKIYICKILKGEDKRIPNRSSRSDNYLSVIYSDCLDAGIKVVGISYDNIPARTISPQMPRQSKGLPVKHMGKSLHTNNNKYFIIVNEYVNIDGFDGFKFYDMHDGNKRLLGVVHMIDDKRTPSYGNAEMYFMSEFFDEYGTWHRFRIRGKGINYQELIKELKQAQQKELYID